MRSTDTAQQATSVRREARTPSGLHHVVALVRKDIRLEWRGRARINATLFFALVTLLMFSFAVGPNHAMLARHAAGYLWLAIFLASVLALGESLRVEGENGALEGLRLAGVAPWSLFLAKAVVNAAFLWGLSTCMLPVAFALYDANLTLGLGKLVLVLFAGCAAISAPGTLYAAIATQARARDVLLPLLLFPVLVPALLAAVKATDLVLNGDPMGQLKSWLSLLAAFDILYWMLCSLLFGRVIEE
jgi:heme exporter protein B